MQLKLFGSTGPTPAFRRDFGLLTRLDDRELELLASWFSDAPNVVTPSENELVSLAAEFQLNPEELGRAIAVIRFILNSWRELDLSLEDVNRDLETIFGHDHAIRARIHQLLGRLADSRDRVHRAVLRRAHETSGLATIDDVTLLWDIRPVFGDFTYPPEANAAAVTELLDYTYVLILEFEASHADGKSETTSVQLSEDEFLRLAQAIDRAKQQLEVLKMRAPQVGI